jgi:hypothetical protein
VNTAAIATLIGHWLLAILLYAALLFTWPDRIVQIIGFSAVMVALFHDKIYSYFVPIQLDITVSEGVAHLHEVDSREVQTGKFAEKQTWLGVIVENNGFGIAKDVELFFSGINSSALNGFGGYRSIPLIRSWVGSTSVPSLSPGIGIRFDVCFLRQTAPEDFYFHLFSTPNALGPIRCPKGKQSVFEFQIVALSSNSSAVKQKIHIEFYGEYTKNFKVLKI